MPVDQLSYGLPIREFLLVGLVSAVVTLLLTGPVRMLALKAGAVAWPRGRDVHVTPTPRWGGLAMFGGVLAGLLLALSLPALRLAYFEGSSEVMGVVVATGLLVGVGLLDDRFDLDAITKFAAQVTAGGLLVLYGVQWTTLWIPLGGGGTGISGSTLILGQGQSVLLTVLLTVALVNAMNFVDGLDGLAGGIGLITTLATAVFCVGLISENGNAPAAFGPALIAVVLAGACLGFLPHNFHPARIFMGDTGSMMVGVMLSAAITAASGRVIPDEETSASDFLALVAPLIVLVGIVFIPVLDLLMAVIRRTRAGTSPFSPDKMHLHHRLLQLGHSHRRAVLLVYLWAAVLAFGAVALALVDETGVVLAAIGIALVVAFVASAVPHLARTRSAATAGPAASASAGPAATSAGAPASADDVADRRDPPAVGDDARPRTSDGPGPVPPPAPGQPGGRQPGEGAPPGRTAARPVGPGTGTHRPGGPPPVHRSGETPSPPLHRSGETPSPPLHRSDEPPAHLPGKAPAHRPGEAPAHRPGDAPAHRPGEAPAHRTGETPAHRSGETPVRRTGETPVYRSGETPVRRTGETPVYRPGGGPAPHRTGEPPARWPGARPAPPVPGETPPHRTPAPPSAWRGPPTRTGQRPAEPLHRPDAVPPRRTGEQQRNGHPQQPAPDDGVPAPDGGHPRRAPGPSRTDQPTVPNPVRRDPPGEADQR
ncbi:hypothetical protein GCM10009613_38500 [Pseudonocardia kongjuensis]|uniref:Undecaprenyl/decaprenyl-phosphate alpha-N-acetylglucosaminyl 1-phosphate transferase n=1 Tax=Pseudonocardia kongjuensis TaxID=102227 RepID=A0ABN1XY45_9PSEU